jgi:MFS family permease
MLIAQSGLTLYLPSLPAISVSLSAYSGFAALTLTVFLLGMGMPTLLWPRVSGLIGSRNSLIAALCLFALGSAGAGLALDTGSFLACRFTQGMAAGAISVMVRAMLRDSFHGRKLAEAMSWLSVCFVVSLGLAQLCGSSLFTFLGWQSTFVVSATASALIAFTVARCIPKPSAVSAAGPSAAEGYAALLRNPRFIRPVCAGGMGYGVIIVFSTCAPGIFQMHYSWSVVEFGLLGIPVSGAYLMGALSVRGLVSRRPQEQLLCTAVVALFIGALIIAGGYWLFPSEAIALWLPYCVLLAIQAVVYPLSLSVAAQAVTADSVRVMALTGIIHQLIAAACGFAVSFMPPAEPRPFVLACIALTAVAILVYVPIGRMSAK